MAAVVAVCVAAMVLRHCYDGAVDGANKNCEKNVKYRNDRIWNIKCLNVGIWKIGYLCSLSQTGGVII
jgi:hypothetical protein